MGMKQGREYRAVQDFSSFHAQKKRTNTACAVQRSCLIRRRFFLNTTA